MFPFTLYADETTSFTSSPYAFRGTFLANKPEKMPWYAYNVVIQSPTQVEFVVYDMRDTCYGGIGDLIGRFSATVSPKLTRKAIEKQALWLATVRRDRELAHAESAIIQSYADELLAAMLEETATAA